MQLIRSFYLSLLIVSVPAESFAEQDFSQITLKTTPVGGAVYMLEGVNGFAGGNIAVSAGNDGILIVDDQYAGMSKKIKKTLTKLNPGKLRYILNTHWHADHTGGNHLLSHGLHSEVDHHATIIAHDNVRKRLMTAQENAFGKKPAAPADAWPVITFNQSLTLHFNDDTIKVIHFKNGHTDGDSVIYFVASNVVHMGDHFFNGTFPFIDLATGGNAVGFTQNVGEILLSLPNDTKVIPGHGPLANKNDLSRYHQMLEDSLAFVRQRINAGDSLASIQQEGMPASFKTWGNGFINEQKWLKIVYDSLKARE